MRGAGTEYWTFPGESAGVVKTRPLSTMKDAPSGGNSTMVYFMCDDCATQAGSVAHAGGRVHREKMSIDEHGFIVLAFDTEGILFGLHSKK